MLNSMEEFCAYGSGGFELIFLFSIRELSKLSFKIVQQNKVGLFILPPFHLNCQNFSL